MLPPSFQVEESTDIRNEKDLVASNRANGEASDRCRGVALTPGCCTLSRLRISNQQLTAFWAQKSTSVPILRHTLLHGRISGLLGETRFPSSIRFQDFGLSYYSGCRGQKKS